MKIKHLLMTMLLGGAMTSCGGSAQHQETSDVNVTDEAVETETVVEAPAHDSWTYVPGEYGDCYIGERIHTGNDGRSWCEITFYPDNTCEFKTESTSLKGTFGGKINDEGAYQITVNLSDGESYIFEGDQSHLVADDGIFKIDVSQEM